MIKISGKIAWRQFYFLLLLPLFFVLHGYTENYPVVPAIDCFLLFLKYSLVAVVLTGLFFLVIRLWKTAAILAFLVMAFHIFFGPVHDALKHWFPDSFIIKYSFLLPATFIVFIGMLIYFRKKQPQFGKLSRYLNVLFLIFILIDAIQLGIKIAKPANDNFLSPSFVACDTCSRPDIYLIIADAYSGKIPLQEIFKFDNSAFENELTKRGFHIVDSSLSNYNYTPFTIGSMLGMQYLQGIEGKNKSLNDRKICFMHINKNPVIDFLKYNGYTFRNHGIFQFADKLPYKSTTFYKTGIDLVKAQTFLSRMNRDIRFNLVTKFKIKSEIERISYYHLKINEALYERTWNEAKKTPGQPRFVYTHLEMPHYPYYFDRNGKPNSFNDIQEENQTNTKQYIEYLQYCNKKFLELIDHLFANSKQPPIILFMSDHAFREYANDTVDHKYHFMNFNAVYLPNKKYQGFYNGMSTVNQFRVLLNSQFNQRLPLLKDSTSYLTE